MDASADAWASGRRRSRLAASTRTASAAYVGQIVIVQDSLRRSLTPTASNSDSHQDAFLMYERIYRSDVVQNQKPNLGAGADCLPASDTKEGDISKELDIGSAVA